MQREAKLNKLAVLAGGLALFGMIVAVEAQPPAAPSAPGRGGAAGRGNGGRFKNYPAEAVNRGLTAYNTACGYCHGERGKSGKAGPDLIASLVTLHDEDGVRIASYIKGPEHTKAVKLDVSDAQIADIAAYLHSRVTYASGRGSVHVSEVLVGDPKAGEAYFNGAGGCNKCHSASGDLKGVGARYDAPTLQERLVMPRTGRGGFGRGAAVSATSPYATVTLPSGETLKGTPVRVTDFDVTLRFADGSTQTWAREHGVPKVEITDPLQAHIDIMTNLSDNDMHNLTAYLATFQ
jgi:cytochrome c oxidase cbb3-type subunit 3